MAYYSSTYYETNLGESYQPPYHDYVSSQAHSSNAYNYNDYNSFQYDSAPCYVAYEPKIDHSNAAYTFSEPNDVDYALNPYGDDYGMVKTQFIVSYSVSEFNEPAFDEYDPTPYGGGYDPVATYGKPLPPSEKICYPRSSSNDPSDQALNNSSHVSIQTPSNESKAATAVEDQEQQTQSSMEDVNVGSNGKPIESSQAEESKEDDPDVHSNGSEHEKRVSQIPPGYGLEAMDLCESLFGHWPCLDHARREEEYCRNRYGPQAVCGKWSDENYPWEEETANYLFGSSYPYGEQWSYGGIYEHPIFNYERHYEGQLVSRQMEYQEEHSWLN